MAETTLVKKLLMKPGYRMLVVNAPQGYRERLNPLPEGAAIETDMNGTYDWLLAFFKDRAEVDRLTPDLLKAAKPDGLVWFAYPKKSKTKTDISRDEGWETVHQLGWEGVTLIAVDDVWSAMRYRPIGAGKSGRKT